MGRTQPWYTKQRDFTPRKELRPLEYEKKTEEEIVDRLCERLRAGSNMKTSCTYAGTTPSTVHRWKVLAAQDRAVGEDTRYVRWVDRILEAENEYIVGLEDKLNAALEGDGKLILEVLRRRQPATYAEPATQIEVKAHKMSEAEIAQRIEELKESLQLKALPAFQEAEVVEENKDE